MLCNIAVEKKIDACETAQVCIRLRICEFMLLGESPYTSHHILQSVKYIFPVHNYALVPGSAAGFAAATAGAAFVRFGGGDGRQRFVGVAAV